MPSKACWPGGQALVNKTRTLSSKGLGSNTIVKGWSKSMDPEVRILNELRLGPFPRMNTVVTFDVAIDCSRYQ